jgi:lysine biosynthesis protein LysW
MKANCISCQEVIDVGSNPALGESVICQKCTAHLEVIWLDPLELDWPADDYDYEDDYERNSYDHQ